MYWYQFDEDDLTRAREQAEAQAADSASVGESTRLVGNLGEIAFNEFLERTLGPPDDGGDPSWEYHNGSAIEAAEPEYNLTDFRVGWYSVDVKTAYDIWKFAPEAMYDDGEAGGHWVTTHQEGHHRVDETADAYVFVSLSNNGQSEEAENMVATILGWAGVDDLKRDRNNALTRPGGPRLSLRNFPELFVRAGFDFRG